MYPGKPPIQRNSSNSRMMTVNSKRGANTGAHQMNKNNSQLPDDFRSDFGGAESNLSVNNMSVMMPSNLKKFGANDLRQGN